MILQYPVTFYFTTVILIATGLIFMVRVIMATSRMRNRQLQDIIDERDRTMKTISTEIHDNANQMLNFASMTLQMAKPADAESERYLTEATRIMDNVISDMLYISHSLNPDYISRWGLLPILEQIAEWVNITKKLTCNFEIIGKQLDVAKNEELMMMRIVQEAVNNAVRHSGANNLIIRVSYGANSIEVCVIDDGDGFDYDSVAIDRVGIQSMLQRATIIKGHFDIHTAPGRGTEVCVSLKLNPENVITSL